MKELLIETWQIHNRVNLYLIDNIESDECLNDKTANKGRNVGQQFVHIHNVRLMWLKEAAPQLLDTVAKIEKDAMVTKKILKENLSASGRAIEKLLEKGIEENKIKGFKPHPTAFLGYLVSHESHHRGQIVISLKYCDHPISKKAGFGLWQWGTR